jgi:hypothetical protein
MTPNSQPHLQRHNFEVVILSEFEWERIPVFEFVVASALILLPNPPKGVP